MDPKHERLPNNAALQQEIVCGLLMPFVITIIRKEVVVCFSECLQTPRANVDMSLKAAAVVIADLATKQWLTHADV